MDVWGRLGLGMHVLVDASAWLRLGCSGHRIMAHGRTQGEPQSFSLTKSWGEYPLAIAQNIGIYNRRRSEVIAAEQLQSW